MSVTKQVRFYRVSHSSVQRSYPPYRGISLKGS